MITYNHLLLICTLTVATTLSCFGQERVVLLNGKVIEGARLFKERETFITYERNLSLHDVEKYKIDFIETRQAIIRFDENGKRITQWKQGATSQPKEDDQPDPAPFQFR